MSYSSHSLEYESTGDLYHLQRCTVCDYKTAEEKHSIATTTHSDGKKEQFCEVCNKYTKTLAAVATETKTVTAVEKATGLEGEKTNITIVKSDGTVTTEEVDNSKIVKNTETVNISAEVIATAETSTSSSTTTTEEKKETTVSFPAGALKMVEDATEVKLTITALTAEEATASDSEYQGEKTGTTTNAGTSTTTVTVSTSEAVVAGIEFKLSGADSSSLSVKKTESAGGTTETGTTVTTYIATGLCESFDTEKNEANTGIEIKYIGTNSGTKPTVVSYNTSTGKLVFRVYHFSKYAIIATNIVATDNAGKMYTTLDKAVSGVTTGETITLLKDVDLTPKSNEENETSSTSTIDIEKSLTLNLNGKILKSNSRVFLVKKGTLTITNGTITADITTNKGQSVIRVSCDNGDAGVVLKSDAVIEAPSSYGITAFGTANKATLDIYGTIESANPCIGGNGSKDYFENTVTMNVYSGAVLTQDSSTKSWEARKDNNDPVAIYQPNIGVLNIYGGTITSKNGSAVEVRAGVANISGGTLTSEALKDSNAFSKEANGSGPTVIGAAVAVSQHTTMQTVTVTISGGTFSASGTNGKQLAIVDTLTDSKVDNKRLVKAIVKSGVDMSADRIVGVRVGGSDGVDGTYYVDADSALANGAASEAKIGETDYLTLLDALKSAKDNETIVLYKEVKLCESVTLEGKKITLDLDGKAITKSGEAIIEIGTEAALKIENSSSNQASDFISAVVKKGESSSADGTYYPSSDAIVSNVRKGDIVVMGTIPAYAATDSHPVSSGVEWKVLNVDSTSSRVLVISRNVLPLPENVTHTKQNENTGEAEEYSWSKSGIKTWLNNTEKENGFVSLYGLENVGITDVELETETYGNYEASVKTENEKVFLLSWNEVTVKGDAIRVKYTDEDGKEGYTFKFLGEDYKNDFEGKYFEDTEDRLAYDLNGDLAQWWLRSPELTGIGEKYQAALVEIPNENYYNVSAYIDAWKVEWNDRNIGVRPAFWLDSASGD